MKRYYEGHRGMLERVDGEWIRYADHCETMKRIAAAPVALEQSKERDASFEEWIYSQRADVDPYEVWQAACAWQSRMRAALTPPRQMVADSAGGAKCDPDCVRAQECLYGCEPDFSDITSAPVAAPAALTDRQVKEAFDAWLTDECMNVTYDDALYIWRAAFSALLAAQPPAAAEAEKLDSSRLDWLEKFHVLTPSLSNLSPHYGDVGMGVIERTSDGWMLDKELDSSQPEFDTLREAIDAAMSTSPSAELERPTQAPENGE